MRAAELLRGCKESVGLTAHLSVICERNRL